MPSGLDLEASGGSNVLPYCFRQWCSKVWSHWKHDIDALSWLNEITLERVPTPLVRCSAHGCSLQD